MQQNDEELLKLFGQRLKNIREMKNSSLNRFVFNNGFITTSTQSRIENGLVDFKFTTLVKIANALDISLCELFKDFDYKYEDIE